ncbi:MAG: hypothetical protein M3R04_06985 [bacterium]|nr:hypothetical protein [bacterium]
MAIGMVTGLRNARLDAITTFAGGSCKLRIYDGTRPATGGTATTLLAELTCNATFAPAAASSVLTLNAITQDTTADATGTATWARILKSDGTTIVLDCSVGTAGTDIVLNTASIVINAIVSVTSATITESNA